MQCISLQYYRNLKTSGILRTSPHSWGIIMSPMSTMLGSRSAGSMENLLRISLRRTQAFMSTSGETFFSPPAISSFESKPSSQKLFTTRGATWRSNTIASEQNFRWEVGIVEYLVMFLLSIITFIIIFRCCSYSWSLIPGSEGNWGKWSWEGTIEFQVFECCTGDHLQWCRSKLYWEAKRLWLYW